jgi:Domain of unknown function (DUF4259)
MDELRGRRQLFRRSKLTSSSRLETVNPRFFKFQHTNINMGAWSTDSFGNNTACDWAYGLEKVNDLSLIRVTVQKVMDSGNDYLEAPDAVEAIAAVEVIARLKGNFGVCDSYTETTDKWVQAHPQPPPADLVALAGRTIDRVLNPPSELLELWQESDDFATWKTSLLDLKNRALK